MYVWREASFISYTYKMCAHNNFMRKDDRIVVKDCLWEVKDCLLHNMEQLLNKVQEDGLGYMFLLLFF